MSTETLPGIHIHTLTDAAKTRHDQALWYVWGREDAGDTTLSTLPSFHHLGNDFGFADYAAMCAERYAQSATWFLHCVGDQYKEYVGFLTLLTIIGGLSK